MEHVGEDMGAENSRLDTVIVWADRGKANEASGATDSMPNGDL